MGFSINDSIVRGELFTTSGKWKYTVAIDMTEFYDTGLLHDDVERAYWATSSSVKGVVDSCGEGYMLVVLDPCHKNGHPVMIKLGKRQ